MSQETSFASQVELIPEAPVSHLHYAIGKLGKPETYLKSFKSAWKRDLYILRSSLPSGIKVKFFEDRMDLVSAMITGPTDTPYEGCLFFFDVMLPSEYPKNQPLAAYISCHKCFSQIHPNIFRNGSICLSLLNHTSKRPQHYSMYWMPGKSTLLQLFVSLQGLVLAKDPLNNLSLKKIKTIEESMEFNRTIVKNVIRSMTNQIYNPLALFKEETLDHYRATGMATYEKMRKYTSGYVASEKNTAKRMKVEEPPFPLLTPIPEDLLTNFYDVLWNLVME